VKVILILASLLSGCATPYVFGELCYDAVDNDYNVENRGGCGAYGGGVEFDNNLYLEFRHRSQFKSSPEIVTNDFILGYKLYLGKK